MFWCSSFQTFICLPASLIDFYNVGENKSFEGIAGADEASKLFSNENKVSCQDGEDDVEKISDTKKAENEVVNKIQSSTITNTEAINEISVCFGIDFHLNMYI